MLVDIDSRTVAMEVGIRQGVCNNSPAESTSPENGWRCSVGPIPDRRGNNRNRNVSHAPTSRTVAAVSTEGFGVGRAGAAAGADLGGSSKYSNENFED